MGTQAWALRAVLIWHRSSGRSRTFPAPDDTSHYRPLSYRPSVARRFVPLWHNGNGTRESPSAPDPSFVDWIAQTDDHAAQSHDHALSVASVAELDLCVRSRSP